ncbi:MAG: trypsin-like serine protease [Polyangia bacterium]
MKLNALVLVLGAVAAGCESPQSTESATAAPIIGGTADSTDSSVVALYAQTKTSGALCTASVIAPTVLLTAAHCVAPGEIGQGATFVALPSGNLNESTTERWTVKETHFDPAFDATRITSGHDIAVVILDEPVKLAPLAVNQADIASLVGSKVRLVGYGVNDGTAQTGAGIKRSVSALVDTVDDKLIQIGGNGKDTCQGDSGGPALATIGGKKVIVGVTSFGQAGCGGGGYDTRVDRYAAFLAPYLDDGASTSAGAEREPNDSSAHANEMAVGSTRGALSTKGDVDWFQFTVPGPSSYTVMLSSARASATFRVYKLAESGALSSVGTPDGDTLSRTSLDGGVYYVKVSDDGHAHTDAGDYTLELR